ATCPTKYYYNNTIEKCELKYQWVNNTAGLGNDARLVRYKSKNPQYIITRLIKDNGDEVPVEGYISKITKRIYSLFYKAINDYKRMEVLLAEPGYYKWEISSDGKVEENAIESGHTNNEIVYTCRFFYDNYHYIGMMRPSTGVCHTTDFLGVTNRSTYYLLTYKI
ncbi:hypothetical protein PV327_011252, partial [Microctonus hyperodae]